MQGPPPSYNPSAGGPPPGYNPNAGGPPPQGQFPPGQGLSQGFNAGVGGPPSQGQQLPPGQMPPSQGQQFPPGQGPPPGYNPGAGGPPPQGQFPPSQGPPPQGQFPPGQGPPPQGQYPGQYPPGQGPAPGQYPQGPPPGQYPPGQFPPAGQYPGQFPPGPPGMQPPWHQQYYVSAEDQEKQRLQAMFASMDRNRSGFLAPIEIAELQFGGGPIGTEAARKLMNVFDKDANGKIDMSEFVTLNQFLAKAQHAFYEGDKDRSGKLESHEAAGALQQLGFQMSNRTVQAVVNKADRHKRGLNFASFLRVAAHLATIRSIFEWNDSNKDGKIELTYDQLAHITTHLLDEV